MALEKIRISNVEYKNGTSRKTGKVYTKYIINDENQRMISGFVPDWATENQESRTKFATQFKVGNVVTLDVTQNVTENGSYWNCKLPIKKDSESIIDLSEVLKKLELIEKKIDSMAHPQNGDITSEPFLFEEAPPKSDNEWAAMPEAASASYSDEIPF